MGGSIHAIKENSDAFAVASKEIGLKVNADKTKYMVMSRDQNSGRSHNIKTDNSFFERVEQFKYLVTTLTYQNSIQKEIMSRLKSGNTCYHLVQNPLSSSLLSKNTKIKTYKTIILPVVLYWCETWSFTLREEHMQRALRRIFGPKRDKVTREWRKLHKEELNELHSSLNDVQVIKIRRMRQAGHVACIGEWRGVYMVLVGNLRERDHLEDPGIERRIILRWIFRKWDVGAWTGLIWLRIGTG